MSEQAAPQPIGRLGFLVTSVLCFVAGLVALLAGKLKGRTESV